MRKLAITLALATTILASPAVARDKSWYAGVEGGGMIVEDLKLRNADIGSSETAVLDFKTGLDADIVGGYDFGVVRAEAEIGYKRSGISEVSDGSVMVDVDGHASALSSMANLLLDFGDDAGISGFVGGGVGVARVKFSVNDGLSSGSIKDSRFAWQAIAGVRMAISPNVDLGLKYRFFNVRELSFNGDDSEYRSRFRSHSLLASLIFNFAPPPPPPPPPVPAPPPPATQTCPDGSVIPAASACPAPAAVPVGPFIVFFDWDKSDITPEAAAILDNAAAAYQQTGKASVMLAGHADRSGSDDYNVALSQRRADAVKAYLAGRGVPDAGVTSQALGESRPLVQTADGVREPQNRRVEITFGPGSGQ